MLSLTIILIDQIVKLMVYYNMFRSQEIPVFGDWFKLHYTTNPGMAFGLEWEYEYGKLFLTLFRLVAMVGIGYYLYLLVKKRVPKGLVWCVALILGGAIGNVIDSTFYGVWLENAPESAITPWFHGQVIDMFYIDIWAGHVPEWVPLWGGDYMALWPIFNIADASIFVGVAIILIFQKKFFSEKKDLEANENEQKDVVMATSDNENNNVESFDERDQEQK